MNHIFTNTDAIVQSKMFSLDNLESKLCDSFMLSVYFVLR